MYCDHCAYPNSQYTSNFAANIAINWVLVVDNQHIIYPGIREVDK